MQARDKQEPTKKHRQAHVVLPVVVVPVVVLPVVVLPVVVLSVVVLPVVVRGAGGVQPDPCHADLA